MTYAQVELVGVVKSIPQANTADDLWVWVEVNFLRFKVIAKGDTLEGFSNGDLLLVKGKLRAGPGGILVIVATTSMTPPG